jgi:pilus assembly protein FimV
MAGVLMKKAVRRVLLVSALMSPAVTLALGLGEIRSNSALNQPFEAEIELVAATAEDLAALRASLASADTFSRYGLDRPAYLSNFDFQVAKDANGRDVIRVTSAGPVTEPFVTLLVEANWPRGRLLREYTVLLDPPVYAGATAAPRAPVAAPRAEVPRPTRTPEPAGVEPFAAAPPPPAARSAPAAAPSTTSVRVQPGSTYRVRPNDTLWRIASQANPGSTSDVNRAMISIYQANPQAFDGNINLLKAGSTLQIPDSGQIEAISAAAAASEVSRQYRLWQQGGTDDAGAPADTGRLKLVTPEQGTTSASTATAPEADASQPGTAALESRVQQLEAELAEARRLLEVRNAELATLQGPAVAVPEPETAPAEVVEAAEPAVGPGEAQPAAGELVAEGPEAAPEAAVPAVAEEAPQAPAAAAAEPEPPGLMARLMEYWWLLAGLVAALVAALLFLRHRRESSEAAVSLEEAMARRESGDLRGTSTVLRSRDTDILVEEKAAIEPAAVAAVPRPTEPSAKPVSIEDTLSGEAPMNLEAGDPLAEADFHMAYGLYDQAADLVQLAIKREPERRDLKLKLLEIFFVWGNRERFLELAGQLNASRSDGGPGEWDKIAIMGKQIAADHALFAGATGASGDLDMELGDTAAALVMDMDMTASDDGSLTPDFDLGTGQSQAFEEGGLDFVIDEPERGATDSESLLPTVETPRLERGAALDNTEEVEVGELGLDVGALDELERAGGMLGDTVEAQALGDTVEAAALEDTAEHPVPGTGAPGQGEEDLLSVTSILGTGEISRHLEEPDEPEEQASQRLDATGELPRLEETATGEFGAVDFSLGEEATTMSEVGTKLDLARAYIDMGDPEGARSILGEVLQEGTQGQKQEANRLMANLP